MNEPTNGELMRVMQRVEGKVDKQGEQIGRLDIRLAVLEDRDTREPEIPKRGRLLAGSGIGAGIVVVIEYLRHAMSGKP